MSVGFVSMPIATPHHPNLGLSLLKAGLARRGVESMIRYFHLDFVRHVGFEAFDLVSDDSLYEAMLGEWLFAAELDPDADLMDFRFLNRVLLKRYPHRFPIERQLSVLQVRSAIGSFMDHCEQAEDWSAYKIVGFSSSFQQHTPALALAKRIKARYPETVVIFGGANCEGEMGSQTLESYPFVDAIFSGEADIAFPDFVERVLAGGAEREEALAEARRGPLSGTSPVEMDELPHPNYVDFYEQLASFPEISARYQPVPLFESARGCWWGAKHHCTFCGLNGTSMAYRSKSPERAFEEIESIARQYGSDILAVDNILDFKYFKTLLPALRDSETDYLIHYETKVNLTADKVRALAEAGVRKIQPGVESLSSHILSLMNKGSTMLQNTQTLKLAAEAGVLVEWAVLYGFPGEREEDYAAMARLVRRLRHLQSPAAVTKVRADRFSPYFKTPEAYGIKLKAFDAYNYIFPFNGPEIQRLAYHFIISSPEVDQADDYAASAIEEVQTWHRNRFRYELFVETTAGGARITDRREDEGEQVYDLDATEAAVLEHAAEIISERRLAATLGLDEKAFEVVMETLESRGLILREGGRLLALPLRQPGYRRALEASQLREPLTHAYFFRDSLREPAE
ncbi:MAG TPA: RiPP maturation radical SAM C-methyltransferase [Thiobacillaceae bacterium]|nr:RiPP maturation radical SAM C-methyltransferase [Thiobacillaceae bacterium]